MAVKFLIGDGTGNNREAKVEDDKSLLVTTTMTPPVTDTSNTRIFRQYLTDDGTSTGSQDMLVNGATTPVPFFVTAPNDADRYVDSLSFAIADQNANLNSFGAITALTNGLYVYYQDPAIGEVVVHEGLKSNFDIIRLCGTGASPIGGDASAYRAGNVQGNSEGYICSLDFSDVFNIPWGVKLKKGSKLRLVVEVRDNVAGIDRLDVIAYGFDRIIKDDQ